MQKCQFSRPLKKQGCILQSQLCGGKNYPDLNYFLITNVKDMSQKLKSGFTGVSGFKTLDYLGSKAITSQLGTKGSQEMGHIPQACHNPEELRAPDTGREVFAFTVEMFV